MFWYGRPRYIVLNRIQKGFPNGSPWTNFISPVNHKSIFKPLFLWWIKWNRYYSINLILPLLSLYFEAVPPPIPEYFPNSQLDRSKLLISYPWYRYTDWEVMFSCFPLHGLSDLYSVIMYLRCIKKTPIHSRLSLHVYKLRVILIMYNTFLCFCLRFFF